MPRPTSFDRVCNQRAMMAYDARRRLTLSATSRLVMACHARCRPTVYVAQRQRWHATPDVVQPCVWSNGDDGMSSPMSFDRVCYPYAFMAWHARRRASCLCSKGYDGMPRRTSFDRVCSPKSVMECHTRRRLTVCALQRQLFHVTPDVVRPCLPSKGYDGMPRSTCSVVCSAQRR